VNEIKRKLKIFLLLFLLITASGTFGFMKLEGFSFVDSLYFNIVTMATVGYGDVHAHYPLTRMFTVFLIVAGGSAFLGVIANATELVILKQDSFNRMRKVNMVLGVFFSEVGNHLLSLFSRHNKNLDTVQDAVRVVPGWTQEQFIKARKIITAAKPAVDADDMDLAELNRFLKSKRDFLVGLVENPALVEHEGFSEALLAVFHLQDELNCRRDLDNMLRSDREHLVGDMNRAYGQLVEQWLVYLEHLKDQYPYIFSLAVRNNPFDPNADPEVGSSIEKTPSGALS
jgi:voltage-gated potassium channel